QTIRCRLGKDARHDQGAEREGPGRTHGMIGDVLGMAKPLLLAPMGFVSGGALAAAVSRAGGLGLIGAGYGDADWIRQEFKRAEGARVGIDFITWRLAKRHELLDRALSSKPWAALPSSSNARPFA